MNNDLNDLFGVVSAHESNISEDYDRLYLKDLKVRDIFSGTPKMSFFTNEDEKDGKPVNYDQCRLRLINDNEENYLDIYMNIPKTGAIYKNSSFYRQTFDLIYSLTTLIDPLHGIDENGEPINVYKEVDIHKIVDFINNKTYITIRVNDGAGNGYNSFEFLKIE